MIKSFIISKDADTRLDKFLKRKFTSLTQSFIEKNIRKKNILINNKKISAKYIVKKNDELKILNFHEQKYKNKIIYRKKITIPLNINYLFEKSIIFENKNFIILNKWSSISTQGGSKINFSIDDIIKNISPEYKLVHRLDKDTSGLLIISKNLISAKNFGNLFKSKLIDKTYLAICEGTPKLKESILKLNIKNKISKYEKTETYYKLLYYSKGVSLILFKPKTGKTHQIRIVAKNIGAPIVGDTKYNIQPNYKKEILKLNAYQLKFKFFNEEYSFQSILPKDFTTFIKKNNLKNLKKYY